MDENRTVKLGCGGCLIELLGLIGVYFVLTHISEIWTALENLVR